MALSAARKYRFQGAANLPDRDVLLGLFEKMVLLRRFESVAQIACRKGETPGFLHLYLGEEATGVGICAHLRPTDWVTSTHRGHGHALAKGADPGRVMAELFGKADGICGGRGGTMHLYDKSVGLFGTNGIVAAGIGHAVGIGMSARQRGSDDIGVAFFGDGAANHGNFHESLNFAAVQNAPVVFVCENNLYATATPLKTITLNPEIASKADSYGMPGVAVDGNDVFAVWLAMKEASERARSGKGPTLIEAKTYRTVGHHEGDPVIGTYRTQEELDAWIKRDPVDMFRKRLIEDYGVADAETLAEIDTRIEKVVQDALEFARRSPEPDPADRAAPCLCRADQSAGGVASAACRRNADARLAGSRPRRHCRGDAGEQEHPLFRRGHRRARRQLRSHQEPLAGVRRRTHGRHADLRTGLYCGCDRRLGDRRAHSLGPDVRRLRVRDRRADFPAGGEAALHEQWRDERSGGGARRRRRAAQLGPAPQRHLPSGLRPHARA